MTRIRPLSALVLCLALLGVDTASAKQPRDATRTNRKDLQVMRDGTVIAGDEIFGSMYEFQVSEKFQRGGYRCGTPNLGRQRESELMKAAADCTMSLTSIESEYIPSNGQVLQIPVVFHVIVKTDGTGQVSDSLVRSQIDILNEDFRAISGTLGGNGTDTKIQFVLATTDPDGNATTGIERVTNNAYFTDPGPGAANDMKQALNWDPSNFFNLYSNDAAGNLGYATFPQEDAGTYQDGVVLLWSSVGRNAPNGGIYNQGRTATHEVGHYLGLFHTFQGGCGTASAPYTTGDLIADTERQQSQTFDCPAGATSCSGQRNPIENYMNYTQDTCMERFTLEQANRMRCSVDSYRGSLYTVVGGGGGNAAPSASFSFTTSGLTASFTDSSTDSDGTVASWAWNFGDGTTSTTRHPSKTYASGGTRTVTLTVTDNDGATNSTTRSVTVTAPTSSTLSNGVPVTGLSGATGSQRFFTMAVPSGATNLRFVTSGGSGDLDLYVRFGSAPTTSTYTCRSWNSNNSETCNISTAQAGTYHVLLNGYAAYSGASLTGSYTAGTTNTPPTANFTFTTSGLTATFTDTSTDAGGSISSWAWNFGDGTTSTTRHPVKTYSSAGTRTVSLTVTDNGGLSRSVSKSVTVSSGPSAPCTGCTLYTGTLSSGGSQWQPNGTYYQSTVSGSHQGWLQGPAGTDFDLELHKWNGSSWTRVARAITSTSVEQISYSGTAGYYMWKVVSYSGSGAYSFWLKKP